MGIEIGIINSNDIAPGIVANMKYVDRLLTCVGSLPHVDLRRVA